MKINKLFDDTEYCIVPYKPTARKVAQECGRSIQKQVTTLCHLVTLTNKFQQPILQAYTGTPPDIIRAVPRTKENERNTTCGHFYIEDAKIERYWNNLPKYERQLSQFKALIAPNLSCTEQMPLEAKRWNVFRNKLMAAWLQSRGISVIPDVMWWKNADMDWCLDGIPRHSVIAINSTGLRRNENSKQIWLEGYKQAVEILKPTMILRYGAKQSGEYEQISRYYPNDNQLLAQERRNGYGW
ncbi:MAG: DUF4417 domain-containing protein [Paludibacteraceae bacterium]|nr:DUF4417 domain-containing protein [Paludibacteraceae bacterium]